MQPYLFPYIGYFQLMHAVDRFIILDDVNYIRGGWINRNRILVNDAASLFTVPLRHASQNARINDLQIADQGDWPAKLLKKISLAYARAPNFDAVYPVVERIVLHPVRALAAYITNSLRELHAHLQLPGKLLVASEAHPNPGLKGEQRILDLCRRESAGLYVNPMGGGALYSASRFAAAGVTLRFLQPRLVPYRQLGGGFVPGLSMIDVLMFNAPAEVATRLAEYDLVAGEAA